MAEIGFYHLLTTPLERARPRLLERATGQCHLNGQEDLAHVTIYFPGMLAHISVNWLSPVKLLVLRLVRR